MIYRWKQALERFEIALRLNPGSARSHFWRGFVFHFLGRVEEAKAELQHAVDLDPLSTLFTYILADLHVLAGQHEKAIEHARRALDIDPNYAGAIAVLGEAYSMMGRHQRGIALLERASQQFPGENWYVCRLGLAYVRGGRQADAERFLAKLEERSQRQCTAPTAIAAAALALGDRNKALKWAYRAIQERDPNLPWLIRTRYFQPLQADPRYHDILGRMNLDSQNAGAA